MSTILMLICLAITHHNSDPIANTVWTFQVGKGCTDTLKLKAHQIATEYDCEVKYTFHGSFKVIKDSLLITEKDDSHSEDSGKISWYRTKYLIRKDVLYCVSKGRLVNNKWKETKVSPPEIGYRRVK